MKNLYKKVLSAIAALAIMVFMIPSEAKAEATEEPVIPEMGVIILGAEGEEQTTPEADPSDMKVNVPVTIPEFGIATILSYDIIDKMKVYNPEAVRHYNNSESSPVCSVDCTTVPSGEDAEFIVLTTDIVNTTLKDISYLSDYDLSVKVIYDNKYEFAGWAYQKDYDMPTDEPYSWGATWEQVHTDIRDVDSVVDHDHEFAIQPIYTGHYAFGCSVPNHVFVTDAPLRMEISFGTTTLTYNIR